ncbi:MAG TPA: ABC transporter permease subunit [Candidatus Sulfotelmatobacter sp.]|jgi:ABC-type transport system involved in multi-copper enzyme maturation permease subunit|nr:ABC transporter permease subunit [Candidatus Sulfotelmatobacter sp.]
MAVYKRTYKAYKGSLTPGWSRFTVLSRYGLATLFNSRPFTAYTVLCFVPFLVGLVFIYFVHSSTAQLVFGVRFNSNPIVNNVWFLGFLAMEAWMGFLLAAWGGPGMITKDFANHSVQLYLSRPLSRAEYLLGKVSVLGTLLSCTTWIPALLLFFLQAQLEGHGWLWQNFWMAGSIFLGCLIWIAMISLLSMTISVWVKWRIAATGLMFGIFFLLPAMGVVLNAILRTQWGMLLNFPYLITMIWAHLFRLDAINRHHGGFDLVPLWSAWASLIGVCALCVWLLNNKLRAREVERA